MSILTLEEREALTFIAERAVAGYRDTLRARVQSLWDGTGPQEFIHPSGSTTHVGLFYADGSAYVPEAHVPDPDVTPEDMHLALAADRCWPLVRLIDVLALLDGGDS